MATDVSRRWARRSSPGYAVVLLGAALFVTSCFLPYTGFPSPAERTLSLYEQVTLPNSGASDLGALLYLFGGVATLAVVASVALLRGGRGRGLPFLLIGAVAAWSLTWIGILWQFRTVSGLFSLKFGFWLQAVSIGVVVIGTIVVWLETRSELRDRHDWDENEERTDTVA
jgi:hypothetical protein